MTKAMDVKFDGQPATGTAISSKGQRYEIVEVKPYRRTDGEGSWIITWQVPCAACGAPVKFETGNGFTPKRRNCDQHKFRIPSRPTAAQEG